MSRWWCWHSCGQITDIAQRYRDLPKISTSSKGDCNLLPAIGVHPHFSVAWLVLRFLREVAKEFAGRVRIPTLRENTYPLNSSPRSWSICRSAGALVN